MGEDTCKWWNRKGINLQNIQTAQQQENKQPNWKMGKDLNRHFSKEDI